MGVFLKMMRRSSRGRSAGVAFSIACLALALFASPALATFPGANGRIAYVAQDTSLHTILPSGHGDRTVAADVSYEAWSPNGLRLAFTRQTNPGTDIFTMRADGTDKRRLTTIGSQYDGAAWDPSYSPGGGRIAFLFHAYKEPTTIATMRNDGSDWQYPVDSDEGRGPVWAPSGRIAYIRLGRSIWDVRSDGSDERRLVALGKNSGYGPIYSPDGKTFLFVRRRQDQSLVTKLANADGTNVRPAPCRSLSPGTGTAGLFPVAYSPDGRWLLVTRYDATTRNDDLLRLSLATCKPKMIVRGVTGEADW